MTADWAEVAIDVDDAVLSKVDTKIPSSLKPSTVLSNGEIVALWAKTMGAESRIESPDDLPICCMRIMRAPTPVDAKHSASQVEAQRDQRVRLLGIAKLERAVLPRQWKAGVPG